MIDSAAKAAARAESQRLTAHFMAAGAQPIEAGILQPADILLDLYGEDIRARAYVTGDPLRGEMMLRPDFTVPVVQMHMASGADPARYTYAGEVFRRQETDDTRPNEFLQVGFELFDGRTPAAADAEVFATIAAALEGLDLRASTGDIGILFAAVQGLRTTDLRKSALIRHIWRPRRFRALMDRYGGRIPVPPHRQALLAAEHPLALAGAEIGLRSRAEVAERIANLRADAASPPFRPRKSPSSTRSFPCAKPCPTSSPNSTTSRLICPRSSPPSAAWRTGPRHWPNAASTLTRSISKAALAAQPSNITTVSSSASPPPRARTCPPSPPGAAMTR